MKKQKWFRRMLAMILSMVLVLGSTAVTAKGEVSADIGGENAALDELLEGTASQEMESNASLTDSMLPDTPSAETVSGPAILRGVALKDYRINEDVYNWAEGEQTVTLTGNDTLTILYAPPEDAKVTIEVASASGSNVTIVGNALEIYTSMRILVKQDINLTLNNLKIVAPDTFGGFFSIPALHWNSAGGAATLTVIGECNLTGSMFSSGLSSTSNQQLTITGNGDGDDRLIAQGGSHTIPDSNVGQPVGDGIHMLGLTGEGAGLTIQGVTVEATGGNDNGSFGVGGCGIMVVNGNINMIDATVTVASGYDSHPTSTRAAILAGGNSNGGGDLLITNSIVTAIGADNVSAVGDAGISASRKVTINSGSVDIRAGDSTSANGGGAINAAELQITGGTVSATGGNSSSQEGGRAIFIWPGELQITGGTVTATAGHSTSQNGGIAIYTGTMQLSGGTVTASGGNGTGNGGHGIFVASGTATIETGTNLTAVGGNGETGVGGVGLRAYGMGSGNTATIANNAGDIYIRGGHGAVQRASVMAGAVYISTGNVGDMVKETNASAFSIKNTPGGDDVYMVNATTSPAAEAIIRCIVGGGTSSEYTYRSKSNVSGTAYLWLPAGAQTLKADNYNDANTTIAANNMNTAALGGQAEVTAHDSEELQTYMAASYVTTINLVSGTTYQYPGGTVSRDLTINGNGAVIEAGTGVSDTVVRSDDITVSSSGLPNYAGVKTFLKVEGDGSSLKLEDVVLRNGINKNGTDNNEDGLFSIINVKAGSSLVIDKVALEGFHNNPVEGNNLCFGIHAEPGAISTVIKNSRFESSNAFRNAVAIRYGAILIDNNTFEGTDYPERLRQSDGYEYAIYLYGGNGTISRNTITGYNNTTQLGYASAGIAVIGFYSTQVTIEDNNLSYNESGIDITGTWSPWSINTNMAVNGKVLDSSEAAYAIGEDLRAANTQDYVSVSHDQNDEVELVDSSSGKSYFAVYGGYRSPWITVTDTEGNTVTLQFPSTETDTLKYADSTEFEVQVDGEATWTEVLPDSTEATEAKLSLQGGHEYTIRAKLTHKSYVEAGDSIERTLITYSNPVHVTVSEVLTAPTASAGEEYIEVTDVKAGAQLKLFIADGQAASTTYKDMGNGTYRFENVLPHSKWYYVIQSVDGQDSPNTPFLNPSFRTPTATGGEGYVDVTNVSSSATIRLYKVDGTMISDTPSSLGNGTYRFEKVTPDKAGFYVTQYANELESINSAFVGVSLPIPFITGGNKQITVTNIFSGARLTLYDEDGTEVQVENNVTSATYQFSNLALEKVYYVIQSINGVVSQASNMVSVYSAAPKFVGGSQSITVHRYPKLTDLRDQLYVSDLDVGQTLTWTVISEPSHGTLTGFPVTASTNGAGGIFGTAGSTDIRIPTSVAYMPEDGYVGSDTFTIQVSDGIATDTRVIEVGVNHSVGSEVTVNNSVELEAAINNPAVATINLKTGTVYQIMGAEINRSLTINGNNAVIEALFGVGLSFDNQTIYHLGMPDGNGNRRYRGNLFWYVKDGGSLAVNNLTLINTATSENEQGLTGIFAAILLNDAADLSLSEVSFKNFWYKNSKFAEQNNLYNAQGLYGTYSDMSYGVYADYNCTGNITVSSSTFGSTNAFRDAIHIYNGNSIRIDSCTLVGTQYPERLREADGYEYGIYLYGGDCSVENNSISGYDSNNISGYSSSGIALLPFNNSNAKIENNIIQGNDAGLDITGGWDTLNPAPEVTINEIALDTEDSGFRIGEKLNVSNNIETGTGANIYIKLDQNDDSNAFVYYSPLLSISDSNTTHPTLSFSQTEDAVELIKSAITIEVQKSEDNGLSWTTASIKGVLDNNSSSVEVNLETNKTYILRVKLTHNNNQVPNTVIDGYSNAVASTTSSSDAGIGSILSKSIITGSEAGTSMEPKTASIRVANSVATVAMGDILKSHAGANVTFYGTDSRFMTPVSGVVSLIPGADTTIYIKITAQDTSTVKYYAVTIKRAASSSIPDPTPGSGSIVTTEPGPVTDKVERITVDVKQGETDNTVAQIVIDRTTHTDGSKSDLVTYQQEKVHETIEKLKEEGKDLARILIPGSGGEVSRTQVTVPSASLNTLSEGKVNLQIDTEEAKIEIPKASLAQANQKLEEDLYFKLIPVKEEEEKREVSQRAISEIRVISNNENTNISTMGIPMTIETNMPSADVDITLPLSGIKLPADTVEREAFLEQLAVFIEHSDGEKELVQGEIVEYRPGVLGIKFHIKKFSTFTIVLLEKSSACDVIKVTIPAKASLKDSKITATVDHTTKRLTVKVTVSDKATWKLYSDKVCSKELKGRKLTLKVGVNTVYLKTTAEDGKTSKIYTVTITRRDIPKQLIIIANKYDFADAFVGGVPALQSGGEVITAGIEPEDAKKLVSYIKRNYTKRDKIYILGLEKAINKDLERLLKKEGYTDVLRIGGKDKYETAKQTAGIVKLSEKVRVVLVNGMVKPEDAESIQKVCAEKGYPILLVQKNNLTTSTLEALKEIKPARVYILGDTTIISAKTADQVSKALKLKNSNIIRIKSGKEIK